MTLAHEVCHLLFDRDFLSGARRRGFVLYSPSPPEGPLRTRSSARGPWTFSDAFQNVEQRANAFAAYLLAPPEAVRLLVQGMDPRSEKAILAVRQEYGVGRETAINLLTNLHQLSRADRLEMMTRPHASLLDDDPHRRFHEPTPEAVGMRRGVLQGLVLRALAAGHLDGAEARDYLRLPLSEPLPEHPALNEAQRAPLRSIEDKVRQGAERYLSARSKTELLYTGRVSREPDGFRVEIVAGHGRGPFRPVGHLRMSAGLEVLENESLLDLSVRGEE